MCMCVRVGSDIAASLKEGDLDLEKLERGL